MPGVDALAATLVAAERPDRGRPGSDQEPATVHDAGQTLPSGRGPESTPEPVQRKGPRCAVPGTVRGAVVDEARRGIAGPAWKSSNSACPPGRTRKGGSCFRAFPSGRSRSAPPLTATTRVN
jgi:hypothetical protein